MGKQHLTKLFSVLVLCLSLIIAGCSDDTGTSGKNTGMSNEERQAKIEQLAQGMEVKNDDMTDVKSYVAPNIENLKSNIIKQIQTRGSAVSYRLGVLKTKDEKCLVEIIELDSNRARYMGPVPWPNLIMKSKNKLYTTEYNTTIDTVDRSQSHDFTNDLIQQSDCIRSIASDSRIKEIKEAVNSGYIKIRLTEAISKENFDYELSHEEIQMLSKVVQIYDLL